MERVVLFTQKLYNCYVKTTETTTKGSLHRVVIFQLHQLELNMLELNTGVDGT